MNANELADELKLVKCLAGDGQVLNDAEAMLRQLQAENEALKEKILSMETREPFLWEILRKDKMK